MTSGVLRDDSSWQERVDIYHRAMADWRNFQLALKYCVDHDDAEEGHAPGERDAHRLAGGGRSGRLRLAGPVPAQLGAGPARHAVAGAGRAVRDRVRAAGLRGRPQARAGRPGAGAARRRVQSGRSAAHSGPDRPGGRPRRRGARLYRYGGDRGPGRWPTGGKRASPSPCGPPRSWSRAIWPRPSSSTSRRWKRSAKAGAGASRTCGTDWAAWPASAATRPRPPGTTRTRWCFTARLAPARR